MRGAVIAGVVFLLALSVGATLWRGKEKGAATACSGDTATQFRCFSDQVRGVAEREGISVALEFVNRAVRPQSTFGITHMVMHEVGHAAYAEFRNPRKALELLPAEALTDRAYFYFEGYQHGVFQMFFADNKAAGPARLIREVCGEFLAGEESEGLEQVRAEQCFHAVGHALMYASGNGTENALAACRALPQNWMRRWCAFGVFMEDFYLYMPFYEPDAPRPDVREPSMAALCASREPLEQAQCAPFVARSYLARHPGAFAAAFAECGSLAAPLRESCVAYAAVRFIPSAFADFSAMRGACRAAGVFESACLGAVAVGIKEGEAGFARRNEPFCETLESGSRTACLKAVDTMYVKLH